MRIKKVMRMYHNLYDQIRDQIPPEDVESVCQDIVDSIDYQELSEKEKKQVDRVIWYLCTRPRGRRPKIPESLEYILYDIIG